MLQLNVDIGELAEALGIWDDVSKHLLELQGYVRPSCSAIVKLLPDQKDIFISHNTWQGYQSMLKVMKYYEFDWHLTREPGKF